MNRLFSVKTILSALIGTSIAGSVVALPAQASPDLADESATELILSQNFPNGDRPISSEPGDDLRNLVGLAGLAIGTGVVGYHLTRAYKPSLANPAPVGSNNASLLDRISPKLRRELLRLVNDRATASRLLSGTLTSHPSRSPNWAAEKVIYDLKRGR